MINRLYCCGFAFSEDRESVLLQRKIKPAWQAGKWNGIVGKVEIGELSHGAMVRECGEETTLDLSGKAWEAFAILTWPGKCAVHFYCAFTDQIFGAEAREDEPIQVFAVDQAAYAPDSLYNLNWLLGLAIDPCRIGSAVLNQRDLPGGDV